MKFVILTDSTGSPRIYPKSERVDLDQTYPYLLKKKYNKCKFWQLSLGNQISELLIDQTRGYLLNWKPDYIILGTGINDARPEAFSEETIKIFKFKGKFSFINRFINKIFFMPSLIRQLNKHRVSKNSFSETIRSLKKTFKESKIIWLEISCHKNYENIRPGVLTRKNEFNKIIKSFVGNNFIKIDHDIYLKNLFSKDLIHFNELGHELISEKIIEQIEKSET